MHLPLSAPCKTGRKISRFFRVQQPHFSSANDNNFNVLADNGEKVAQARDTKLIRAALLLLNEHGLNAAQEAYDAAKDARGRRDEDDYAHWRAVCAKLDGRLAQTLAITSEAG